MFSKLFDFGYQRTGKQAFGFYIVYLIILLVIGAVLNIIASAFIVSSNPENQNLAANKLVIFASISSEIVGFLILLIIGLLMMTKKQKFGDGKAWTAFVLTLFLGYFSPPIGLIGLAVLSTMPKKEVAPSSSITEQVPPAPSIQ
jgi:hypothetical protein